MIGTKTLRSALLGVALLASACGPQYEEGASILRAIQSGVLQRGGQGEGGAVARPQFSRQAIEESGADYILASVPSRSSLALVQRVGANGPEVTWISEDGISVTYERGVLVATRGLGPDLMAANVSGTVAAMRQGGGTTRRVHEYLDGTDQIVRFTYDCRVEIAGNERITIYERSYNTVKYDESCESGTQSFTNSYWVGDGGVVWKSRQLISPPVGYLDSERL